MEKEIYFIADTHFGDSNIIQYENRPFADTMEMDEKMIQKWNAAVEPESQVFVLGDFSFYERDKTKQITGRLHGRKTLVLGNHDTQTPEYYRDCGFETVSKYPIILDGFWMLSHEPLYVNQNMPYANLFGHVHSSTIYTDYSPQSFCVSVERLDYQPIAFSEIKKRVVKIRSDYL